MGFMARNKGSDFTPVPEGTHLAVCCMIVDAGLHENAFTAKKRDHKVIIGWELPNETLPSGDRMHVSVIYTVSLHKKANLRRDLEGWRGRAFTDEELEGFDLRNVIGKACQLSVIHKKSDDDRIFTKVAGIMAIPKGFPTPTLAALPMIYSVDEHDEETLQALPAWVQEMVSKGQRPGQAEEENIEIQNEIMQTSGANPDVVPF